MSIRQAVKNHIETPQVPRREWNEVLRCSKVALARNMHLEITTSRDSETSGLLRTSCIVCGKIPETHPLDPYCICTPVSFKSVIYSRVAEERRAIL